MKVKKLLMLSLLPSLVKADDSALRAYLKKYPENLSIDTHQFLGQLNNSSSNYGLNATQYHNFDVNKVYEKYTTQVKLYGQSAPLYKIGAETAKSMVGLGAGALSGASTILFAGGPAGIALGVGVNAGIAFGQGNANYYIDKWIGEFQDESLNEAAFLLNVIFDLDKAKLESMGYSQFIGKYPKLFKDILDTSIDYDALIRNAPEAHQARILVNAIKSNGARGQIALSRLAYLLNSEDEKIKGKLFQEIENRNKQYTELKAKADSIENLANQSAFKIFSLENAQHKYVERLSRVENSQSLILNSLSIISEKVRVNNLKINENYIKIKENTKNLNTLRQQLSEQSQEYRTLFSKNRTLIQKNNELIYENSVQINFTKTLLFGKLDPSEKLFAIENGYLDSLNLETSKKEEIERKVRKGAEVEKIRNEITKIKVEIRGFSEFAGELSKLASNLNMPKDLVQALSMSARIAQGSTKILDALMQGGFAGGLGMATGLIGITNIIMGFGSSGVASKRHAQIMSSLRAIHEGIQHLNQNQVVISKKISQTYDVLLEISYKSFKNQEKIIKSLDKIYKRNQKNFLDLRKHQHYIIDLVSELHVKEIKQCRTLTEKINDNYYKEINKLLNKSSLSNEEVALLSYMRNNKPYGVFNSYDDFHRTMTQNLGSIFSSCIEGLQSNLNFSLEEPYHISLQRVYQDQVLQEDFLSIKQSMLDLLKELSLVDFDKNLIKLTWPTQLVDNHYYKMNHFDDTDVHKLKDEQINKVSNQIFVSLNSTVNTDKLIKYNKYALIYSHFYDLIDFSNSPRLVTSTELAQLRKQRELAYDLLKQELLPLINGAIAQQGITSGEVILPIVMTKLKNAKLTEVELDYIFYILNNSKELKINFRSNFSIFLNHVVFDEKKINRVFYDSLLLNQSEDNSLIYSVINKKTIFANKTDNTLELITDYDKKGWFYLLTWGERSAKIYLPNSDDYFSRKTHQDPTVLPLVEIRQEILARILKHESLFHGNLSLEDKRDFLNYIKQK